jgi:hypothetical protein
MFPKFTCFSDAMGVRRVVYLCVATCLGSPIDWSDCPAAGVFRRVVTKWYSNPKMAVSQAIKATKIKNFGINNRNSRSRAFANWKVQTVYMPIGKTNPQYAG